MNQFGKAVSYLLVCVLGLATTAVAQIPKELWGRWMVEHELPTTTIPCWSGPEAKKLIGTELDYSDRIFRWNNVITEHPVAETRIITAKEFHDQNSGGSVSGSQVTFRQIGIKAVQATEVLIHHPDANITTATAEIPGDDVLVKDPNTIVFSVCSVYFEAKRVTAIRSSSTK